MNNRLKFQVAALQSEITSKMKEIHKIKAEKLESILKLLPEEQQILVRACFDAARHHNKKSRRYTNEWIYECIIMRIKAPGLYEKLRTENKIALPSQRTLLRYMQALRPSYGFQENVFTVLKSKAEKMQPGERHGKISCYYLFNQLKIVFKQIRINSYLSYRNHAGR